MVEACKRAGELPEELFAQHGSRQFINKLARRKIRSKEFYPAIFKTGYLFQCS